MTIWVIAVVSFAHPTLGVWMVGDIDEIPYDSVAIALLDNGYLDLYYGVTPPVPDSPCVTVDLAQSKGDMIVATALNTFATKSAGGDGSQLVVDSGTADGTRWASQTLDAQSFGPGSGVWTNPSPTVSRAVRIRIVGGGGSGGAGRRGAAGTIRCGGGGGGGAAADERIMWSDELPATVSVTVGAGAAASAPTAADNTNGADGATGGTSTFGAYIRVAGGYGASGGSATSGSFGDGGPGRFEGVGGRSASTIGSTGPSGSANAYGGAHGGGAGGGITSGNTANDGGAGGPCPEATEAGYTASGGVVDTTAPTVGYSSTRSDIGGGAGGGAASTTTAAQNGATGGAYGAGGGGGGASLNGNDSGGGGAGGNGICYVVTEEL